MRIITWNVNKRADVAPHVEWLVSNRPHIVVMQEVRISGLQEVQTALRRNGFTHVISSVDSTDPARLDHSVVVACSSPLVECDRPSVPWSESAVSAVADLQSGQVVVTGVHVPTASPHRDVKTRTITELVAHFAKSSSRHQVLCGDMNAPCEERNDGTIITFSQRRQRNGSYGVPPRLRELDAAERSLLTLLPKSGMVDAYRPIHGFTKAAASWRSFRLDHLFTSSGLQPVHCEYHQEVVEVRLSDHAALEADVKVTVNAGVATSADWVSR